MTNYEQFRQEKKKPKQTIPNHVIHTGYWISNEW